MEGRAKARCRQAMEGMGPPEPWKAGATIPILFLKRTLPFTKEALQKIKQQKMLKVTILAVQLFKFCFYDFCNFCRGIFQRDKLGILFAAELYFHVWKVFVAHSDAYREAN